MFFRSEFLTGSVNKLGLLKCSQIFQPGKCRASQKLFSQEPISERMCEQIGVVEVHPISSLEIVEAIEIANFESMCEKIEVPRISS